MLGKKPGFKTRKDLAQEYNIDPKTFDRKIEPVKWLLKQEKPKKLFSPNEQKVVREYLGGLEWN